MKLTFKKRNVKQSLENWWDEYKEARRQRQLRRIEKLEKWHEAYAWYPMRLTTDDDSWQFAWFTKVRQKYWAARKESTWGIHDVVKKSLEERHTSKDFFKMKLGGEIENDDDFVEMSHDGTNVAINPSIAAGSKAYVKKADKNDHISMWG